MVRSYMTNLKQHLLDQLSKAETSVDIAVAWFTEDDVLDKLTELLGIGVKVKIFLSNSSTNFQESYSLNFDDFKDKGGQLLVFEEQFLHHKFSLIDDRILVSGTVNYTYYGFNKNAESIFIIENEAHVIASFQDELDRLQSYFPEVVTGIIVSPTYGHLREEIKFYKSLLLEASNELNADTLKLDEYESLYRIRFQDILSDIYQLKIQWAEKQALLNNAKAYKEQLQNQKNTYSQFRDQVAEDPLFIRKHEDKSLQKKLRQLFLKGVKLCHPDVLAEKRKTEGAKVFDKLSRAYHDLDLEEVQQIVNELETGIAFENIEDDVSDDLDQLQEILLKLKKKWEALLQAVTEVTHDERYIMIHDTELLNRHFEEKEEQLQTIRTDLHTKLKTKR